MPPIFRILADAPRWLFLAVLVYAPWAYGCTRPWTIALLDWLLAITLVLWIVEMLVRKQLPEIPRLLLCAVFGALLLGWAVTLNARSSYDPDFHQFVPRVAFWRGGPGSVDRETSLEMMQRVTALAGALLFIVDLARRRQWRERVWWTIVLTGASIAGFGLLQKIAEAPMIFWEAGREGTTFFATYYYHGNAAAFINLVLPLAAGLAIVVSRRAQNHGSKALTFSAFFLVLVSAFVNVSKAGMLIAVGLLVALAAWQSPRLLGRGKSALLALLATLIIVGALGYETAAKRWAEMPKLMTAENPRLLVARTCLDMLPSAGAFGFGPGTFETVFPHFNHEAGARGIWRYAHEDYLQTALEWGWAGAGLWAIVFAGGIVHCFRHARRQSGRERVLLLSSGLALCGIALHAAVDFPLQIASLQLYTAALLAFGWSSGGWRTSGVADSAVGRSYAAV